MAYIAVMKVDGSGTVEKYLDFDTLAEAQNHVATFAGDYPAAFAAESPGGGTRDWIADPVAKTLIYSNVLAVAESKTSKINAVNELRDIKKALPILSQGHQVDTGDLDVGVMATKIHAASLIGTAIVSITNSGGVAAVTTAKNHHIKTGGTVAISGADQAEYNVTADATKVSNRIFTYPIAGTPAAATGTMVFAPTTMRFIPTTNQITFVDAGVFREIYLDVEEYIDTCQINARELKNQVLAAADVAAVDAIDITAGWPDTGI